MCVLLHVTQVRNVEFLKKRECRLEKGDCERVHMLKSVVLR